MLLSSRQPASSTQIGIFRDILEQGHASENTDPDIYAAKHQSAGKLKSDQHRPKSSTSGRTGPDISAFKYQSIGKPQTDTDQKYCLQRALVPTSQLPGSLPVSSPPADLSLTDLSPTDPSSCFTGTDSPSLRKATRKDSISSLESGAESDIFNRPPVELFVEEGELSDEQDIMEQEQPTSEEQTYRETMRGICSFMGWTHVPDMDSSNPSDHNPFTGPKAPVPSKVSVQICQWRIGYARS